MDILIETLVSGGFLSEIDVERAKSVSAKKNITFEQAVIDQDLLSDEHLGRLISETYNWRYVNLRKVEIDDKVFKLIPLQVAEKQKIIAFSETEEGVKVAMNNPEDQQLLHLLKKIIGKRPLPHYATKQDLKEQLRLYKTDVRTEFEKIIKTEANQAVKDGKTESSTIQIINMLLTRGYESNASDIHIEPYEDTTVIRFRIDGVMHEVISVPKNIHNLLISRLKVLAKLRTDEHQVPQDGKLQYLLGDEKADVRVSIVPTTKGENAVMRLLSQKSRQFSMQELGLSDRDYERLLAAIKKPWGMILSTGPTGSGKTTSLYAILKILNQPSVNISTIEDPVEYNINGITQIQVHNQVDLSFASGLRAIVRQDPDVIMVGEVRDKETASIAVNSAMTGHLVLSTLHTNDAPTALPRLLDMNIEPFLIASTVNVIIAQRLVRKICQHCIHSVTANIEELSQKMPISVLEKLARGQEEIEVFEGSGCKVCNHTGYSGRTGIFELLEINDEIRKLIMEGADADLIKKTAVKHGMTTMFDDAREKVLNGVTTVDEMLRVVKQ